MLMLCINDNAVVGIEIDVEISNRKHTEISDRMQRVQENMDKSDWMHVTSVTFP